MGTGGILKTEVFYNLCVSILKRKVQHFRGEALCNLMCYNPYITKAALRRFRPLNKEILSKKLRKMGCMSFIIGEIILKSAALPVSLRLRIWRTFSCSSGSAAGFGKTAPRTYEGMLKTPRTMFMQGYNRP